MSKKKQESVDKSIKLYIVLYHHHHGTDAWPDFQIEEPNVDRIVEDLKETRTWDESDDERGSYIEVLGPFDNPYVSVLKQVSDDYDNTGCEACGVINQATYERVREILGYD